MANATPLRERFSGRFRVTPSCWIWTAGKDGEGYGQIANTNRNERAHRVSYRLHVGPIPEGMQVLHKCDNPSCVNPEHLFLGTCADNMVDKKAKKRANVARGERHYLSKLTNEQVLAIRASDAVQARLCEQYGVRPSTISDIKHLKRWRHV